MGLSIYYRFKVKTDAEGARLLVRQLREFAKTLPFGSVSRVEEYDPPDGRCAFPKGRAGAGGWKPGHVYLPRKRADGLEELVDVPALHAMSFMANARGSETAEFGLASHPPVVVHREDVVTRVPGRGEERRVGAGPAVEFPTRLRGWYSWSACCKTQYAANPKYGGIAHFLRVHRAIFAVLDECKRLGMTTRIRDDGKYWRHRDDAKLVAELQKWDELVAGFAGKLCDALGSQQGTVLAPIRDRQDFEHLEAKGARRLAEGTKRQKRRREADRLDDERPAH
jgi:hypothetical protein